MAERALAHVEKIEWIRPIEGADNIELIGILGWVCVAKKGEFNVGDMAVYIEIDSKCPETDERFAFLANKKFKVKTMKLGKFKVISQGLALPLSLFPELQDKKIGDDVTEALKITYASEEDAARKTNKVDPNAKYKSMAARHKNLAKKKWFRWLMKCNWGKKILFLFFGKKKDNPKEFPKWITKTDETRCLNCNTKIETSDGKLRISDIINKKMNVLVKSYNEDSGLIEYKRILDFQKFKHEEPWVNIKYSINKYGNRKNTIKCTLDHKFLTPKGYTKAENLKVGDTIFTLKKTWSYQDLYNILGMIIGDAHITIDKRKNKDNSSRSEIRLQLTQGEKQIAYLKEKVRILEGDLNNIRKAKSGYCDNAIYQYTTKMDYGLTNLLYDLGCITNQKFHITKEFCDVLTLQALAFWYMDDGTLRHRDGDHQKPSIQISTNSETLEENNYLIDMLRYRFGVECNYRKDKSYGSIYLTVNGTKKFLSMITRYIPYSMRYKTIPEFENQKYDLENITYKKQDNIIETKITDYAIKSLSVFSNNSFSYDIEVEDNHNFFANGILTHNCENIPWVLNSTNKWIKTEKCDGTSCTFAVDRLKKGKNKFDFIVCSRNVRQADREQACYHESNIYWELADKYDIEKILTQFATENNYNRVVLQGEGVGSVQGNPYKFTENKLFVFNLIIDGVRLGTVEMADFCKTHGLTSVPIINTAYELPKTMEEMKLEADGYSELNPKVKREGFVYRDISGQKSFKNVSREYLLKYGI